MTERHRNGKPLSDQYVATITVEHHLLVTASSNAAARRQVERLGPARYGSGSNVKITSIEKAA